MYSNDASVLLLPHMYVLFIKPEKGFSMVFIKKKKCWNASQPHVNLSAVLEHRVGY